MIGGGHIIFRDIVTQVCICIDAHNSWAPVSSCFLISTCVLHLYVRQNRLEVRCTTAILPNILADWWSGVANTGIKSAGLHGHCQYSFEITSSYIEAMHLITTTIVILSAFGAAFGRLECTIARPHGMCGTPTPGGLRLIMSNLTPPNKAQPRVYAGCQTTPYCGDDWMWKRVDAAMGSGEGIPKDATFDQHCQEMPK
ncbi:hypothetical protein PGT21_030777 [Puccinia graminis f. sp. tritici]|uniref:Uncharacterized protein n=1 Tax=Puccinia graminis f. sp. tritici TaxID=56615 RepID=A0A5B0LYS6_PUCGR|nr:hypothetical protein PGT21_030777 [Puccinia graminis f. sp. tritici]